MRTLTIGMVCLAFWAGVRARGGEPAPAPAPVLAPAPAFGDAKNDLPLEIYQKLKRHVDAMMGVTSGDGPKMSKDEAEKAFKADSETHKALLLKALNASQVIHRLLAALALEHAGDAKAVVEALDPVVRKDPDADVRMAAAGTLSALKDAAGVDALLKALEDPEVAVRAVAATGLGQIKDTRATTPLLDVLARDAEAAVRGRAALALGKIKDPNALDRLVKIFDAEKDPRVRMAIAGAVREIHGQDTPATAGVPSAEDHTGQLTAMARDMREIEEKLRNDRHDQAVQSDEKKVEQQLVELIKKIEEMTAQGQGQSQKQPQQGQQPQQQQGNNPSGQKQPSSPLADSSLGGSAAKGALSAAQVAGTQAEWAKLPPALRDEMTQAYREGMPERWRKRLEAYYLSVAGEESKAKP